MRIYTIAYEHDIYIYTVYIRMSKLSGLLIGNSQSEPFSSVANCQVCSGPLSGFAGFNLTTDVLRFASDAAPVLSFVYSASTAASFRASRGISSSWLKNICQLCSRKTQGLFLQLRVGFFKGLGSLFGCALHLE